MGHVWTCHEHTHKVTDYKAYTLLMWVQVGSQESSPQSH